MSTGLADLQLTDDLDCSYTPGATPLQGNPAPLRAGNYRLRITDLKPRMRDNVPVMTDGKYPVLTINSVEILEPEDKAGKKISNLWHDLRTKPFNRNGVLVSPLADLLAAYDQTQGWHGLSEGRDLLAQFIADNRSFRCQLNWTAYDKAYADAQFLARGGANNCDPATVKAIYAGARVRGMKNFPLNKDGSFNHVWVGPSWTPIEARLEITRFFPSNDTVRLGSF